MKQFKYCLWGIFLPILQATAQQQPISPAADDYIVIKGRVLNEQGEALGGASISLKNGKKSTTTNEKGFFEIKNVPPNSVLAISYTGYQQKEISINGQTTLDVRMTSAKNILDELVVKGYYTTTQRLNTGDVSIIKGEDITKQPVSNPLAALEGRVAGLQITQSSGVPGSNITVRLRGQNSIASGNNPLYIVDGVTYNSNTLSSQSLAYGGGVASSPFNSISPADIENIIILKDADATAIYGSRGANGVILITTKKGKPGKSKFEINIYTGESKVSRKINLLNVRQYLEMRHEAFVNDGVVAIPANAYDINGKWDTTRNTDWQKLFIGGTAKTTNAQLSLSGGDVNTQFLIGADYHGETTVFPGNNSDSRGSMHLNLVHKSSDSKLKSNFSFLFSKDNNQLPQSDLTGFIATPPDAPKIYNTNGSLNWENSTWINPFSNLLKRSKAITNNLLGNAELSYQLFPGLQIKGTFGYNLLSMDQVLTTPSKYYNPAFANIKASSSFASNNIETWNIEPQLNYTRKFNDHKIEILLGSTFMSQTQNSQSETGIGYSSDALIEDIQAASAITVNNIGYTEYKYNAIFGRVGYTYKDKYLINLTARRDGSSRFGPGNQFADFGATGIGWIFSKEKFIYDKLPFISFGKIRGSYGITGNDQIGNYQFLETFTPTGLIYQGVSTISPTQLFNPNYAWEINKKFEVGLELGIINDRLFFNANYYNNRSSHQLVGYPLASMTGFTSVIANLPALVDNTGLEFQITSVNINNRSFTWKSSLNFTVPSNKLISFPNLETSSYANQYEVGQSLFILKKYQFAGVNTQTGIYRFTTKNVNGIPSYPDDYRYIINTSQQLYGGIENMLTYKDWQLDFLFQFVEQKNGRNYFQSFQKPGTMNNQPIYVLDRWRKNGDYANVESFSISNSVVSSAWSNARNSNYAYSNASFIRLKNLSLSYHFSNKWLNKMHFQNARIYLQGQNLFTISKYLGLDPETQGLLPTLRTLTAGVQFTF